MAGAATGLAGGVFNVVGGIKRGNAKKRELREQDRQNRQDALAVLQDAREEEQNFRTAANRQLASARAGASASGVSLAGSAEEALAESARNISADALNIRKFAQRRAAALRRGAASAREAQRGVSAATTLGAIGSGFGALGTFGERGGFKKLGIG